MSPIYCEQCSLNTEAQQLLKHAIEKLGFSARAHDKVLRVARTLADMKAENRINEARIAEAIQYRSLDLELF